MKPFNQINVIPFIDIMLVLLAIVLLTATFISRQQIDLELPTAENAAEETDEIFINIAIDAQQQFYIDDEQVDQQALKAKLDTLDRETNIILAVDKIVPFENFIKIIDLLKGRELEKLSIMVRDAK